MIYFIIKYKKGVCKCSQHPLTNTLETVRLQVDEDLVAAHARCSDAYKGCTKVSLFVVVIQFFDGCSDFFDVFCQNSGWVALMF